VRGMPSSRRGGDRVPSRGPDESHPGTLRQGVERVIAGPVPVPQPNTGWPTPLVGVAVLLVLVSFGRAHELFGPTAALPVGKVLMPIGALLLITRPDFRKRMSGLATTQGRSFQLFLFAMVASIPFSLWPGGSVRELMDFAMAKLPYVLILIGTASSEEELDWLLRAVVTAIVLFGIVSLTGGGTFVEGRLLASSTYDPNDIALMAAVSIPLSLHLVRQETGGWRALGLAGMASALILVLETGSRGGALGVGAVALTYLILFRRTLSGRMKAVMVAAILLAVLFAPSVFIERMSSLKSVSQDYNVTETTGRVEIWKRGVGYFLHRPLTGVGVGQFNSAEGQSGVGLVAAGEGFKWSTAHNSFILAAAELGLPGIVGFLGLFLPIFPLVRGLRDRSRSDPTLVSLTLLGEALAVATIAFFVAGFFLSATYQPPALTLAALGMAFSSIVKRRPSPLGSHRLAGRGESGRAQGSRAALKRY
jgi:O-antigen ligase